MSMLPRQFIEGKRCFIYCGDERCNCDLSPFHPKNIFDSSFKTFKRFIKPEDKTINSQNGTSK
jgi:hypothetical protein